MPPKKATKKGSKSKRIAHNAQAMVISGFLGAGKTTLVEAMLKTPPAGATIAVLVNDLAAVNIDGSQIKKSTDDMVELTNGCICCDLRGELMEELFSVHRPRLTPLRVGDGFPPQEPVRSLTASLNCHLGASRGAVKMPAKTSPLSEAD
eukprot:PhM_4_TR8439/c1_g1_i9/m.3981